MIIVEELFKSSCNFNPRQDLHSRTNVHYLVFHLTVADTIISFVTMPMETSWRIIIEVRIVVLASSGIGLVGGGDNHDDDGKNR